MEWPFLGAPATLVLPATATQPSLARDGVAGGSKKNATSLDKTGNVIGPYLCPRYPLRRHNSLVRVELH
jgi:hypothetical protein